jgi:hypothetical protein
MDKETMIDVVVDRRKWRRGGPKDVQVDGLTRLLNSQGKMCCLGFYALKVGFTENEIFDKWYPNTKDPRCTITEGSAHELININDLSSLPPEERERKLIEAGEKVGIKFSFVN